MVTSAVRELVRERAGRRCEYCHAPEEVTGGDTKAITSFPDLPEEEMS